MLIKALCDYYDLLAQSGKVLQEGYSSVKVKYIVSLTRDGEIDEIINCQNSQQVLDKNGKYKEVLIPRDIVMPQRTEKPGIESNIIEQRPIYLFGLNYDDGKLDPYDKTNKAKKSHEAFVKANLSFVEDLDSPVVNAYRAFIQHWIPENEINNPYLLELGKNYSNSGFMFCLSGHVENLLQDDVQIRVKWESYLKEKESIRKDAVYATCAVSGQKASIARIHKKIRGVYGGLATGNVLISYKNASENSYGNESSYNSNISENAMKKYTEALNYLLDGRRHKVAFDDITVVFWAMSSNEKCSDLFAALCFDNQDVLDEEQTEEMLEQLMRDAKEGSLLTARLASTEHIDTNVDFYILGLKPNSSRLAVKFLYHRKYADILLNIAKHQNDMQITEKPQAIPLWRIKKELISPKSNNETIDPALFTKIIESIMYEREYPSFLLTTMIKRVKTDSDIAVNQIRAGVIKACINRKERLSQKKEELKVALDQENTNSAYLCGRLFAVLEKLQQDASNNSLNRTIKDAYFASAVSKPVLVFPKLVKLAQNHLNKVGNARYYNRLIEEIIDKMQGEFPEVLMLAEQGKFIIGYYQQYQNFFVRKDERNSSEKKEEL